MNYYVKLEQANRARVIITEKDFPGGYNFRIGSSEELLKRLWQNKSLYGFYVSDIIIQQD